MRLPKSFNDITVKQYQDVYFLIQEKCEDDFQLSENWARVISILSGEDIEDVRSLPKIQFKNLIKRLDFILRPEVLQEKVKQYIAVDGWIYKATTRAEMLSVAQATDLKGFQKQVQNLSPEETVVANLHLLLACTYLPLGWSGFKYNPRKHRKVSNAFLKAKVGDVYGTLFFYSVLYKELISSIPVFTPDHLKVLEDHFKEIAEWTKGSSLKTSGVGK